MVGGIVDFAAIADDDSLRAGAACAGRWLHKFVIVTGRLQGQAAFVVEKDNSVVAEPQAFAALDSVERGSQVDVAAIDDAVVDVVDADVVD
jgi:hypothetical protein